jgi:hypothetical protein
MAAAVASASCAGSDNGDDGDEQAEGAVLPEAMQTAIAEGEEFADWQIAESDMNPALPGTFVPTQGRQHFNYTYDPDRTPRAFCDGVATAETPGEPSVRTDETNCYASNPPSSGQHAPSQQNAEVAPGVTINIPPFPDTYPEDIEIPREAIPHILEHAGVFVGYHCADGDAACEEVADDLTRIVDDRIDNNNDRVVLARDSDLPEGTIGMSGWTRVDTFPVSEFTQERVVAFIDAHSCRFDPENFCR